MCRATNRCSTAAANASACSTSGFLEAPFRAAKRTAFLVVGAISLLISVAGVLLTLRWARSIFRPIEHVHAAVGRIEAGDDAARVGDVASRDDSAAWPPNSTACSTPSPSSAPSCRR